MRPDDPDGEALRRRALSAGILALSLWAGVVVLMLLGSIGLPSIFVFSGIAAAALVCVRASSALREARLAGSVDGTVRLVAAGAAFLGVGVTSALLLNAVATLLARDFVF
jgi:hypothetical protein